MSKKHGGHHGGAWKVAYADFVTAMMALFLVLWLASQDVKIKEAVARSFSNPFASITKESTGVLPNKDTQALIEDVIVKNYRETTDAWFVDNDPAASLEKQQQTMKLLTDKGVTIVKADLPGLKKTSLAVYEKQRAKIGKDLVDRVAKAVGYQ